MILAASGATGWVLTRQLVDLATKLRLSSAPSPLAAREPAYSLVENNLADSSAIVPFDRLVDRSE
jgi:hypothetical protein